MKKLKTPLIYEDEFILIMIILLYLERESICLLQTEVMWFYFKIICSILSFYKVYMWYILTI